MVTRIRVPPFRLAWAQLSPDTYNDGWDWCSGYHYSDSSIMGFSHTHLSGTGATDMLDFLLMPGTGPAKTVPGLRQNPGDGYRSRFSHDEEIAEPGYYSVMLRDYNIRAELSATERAGIHQYTFPQSDSSHFIHSAPQLRERAGFVGGIEDHWNRHNHWWTQRQRMGTRPRSLILR